MRRTSSRTVLGGTLLLLVPGLWSCGGGEEADTGDEAAAERAAGPVVPPDSAAAITVSVHWEGEVPEPEAVDMSEEPACAAAYGEEGPKTREVVVENGRLANVFVYVKSGLDRSFPTPSEPVTLDQKNCRYHPRVLGLQTGQTLRITNSDSLLHNINAQPETNRGFNISQPQAGMTTTREFRLPEVMIPVKCDVHGWMSAYIGVLEHPYHATSGSGGPAVLENLPPGRHVLEAWHERYGTLTDTVTLAAGDTASVAFTYSAAMAGAHVPLGEPLIVRHGDHGIRGGG